MVSLKIIWTFQDPTRVTSSSGRNYAVSSELTNQHPVFKIHVQVFCSGSVALCVKHFIYRTDYSIFIYFWVKCKMMAQEKKVCLTHQRTAETQQRCVQEKWNLFLDFFFAGVRGPRAATVFILSLTISVCAINCVWLHLRNAEFTFHSFNVINSTGFWFCILCLPF